ncbi:hypothetical protein BJ166DRAFT_574251 [Pestalotiopsis sp. NC0098]|nr:hypothetical protein BJ166DRAFT_574251 [Pestalotiopsis sp. NC0098]
MPVRIDCVDDLNDGQLAKIKSIWKELKNVAPRRVRKQYKAYTADDFTEFLDSLFEDGWSNSSPPYTVTWKPKKQDMNALSVGVWNKDVGKPRVGSTSNQVPITKQQGARVFCGPEIVGGTVIFKVVDGQGAMHTFGDVKWDMGKSTLTGEVMGAICMHHDRNEF